MIYTIKIDQNEIENTSLTTEQEIELDRRFEYVLQNPTVEKSWDEVEQNLLSK